MTGRFLSYEPRSVLIPADAGVERAFETFELDDDERALCDRRTIFCDVFASADGRQLHCIGPPFLNLGRPIAVWVRGTKRSFRVDNSLFQQRVVLTRIRLTDADTTGSQIDLRFEFRDFSVIVDVVPRRVELPRVQMMLATIQKDNDPQWIADWCAWHRRAHGVERVVIYDNGSGNADEAYRMASEVPGLDVAVVLWDFPYGPPGRFSANFAQSVALNHCRLTFAAHAKWCISLDVDEYLYNDSNYSLEEYLDRRKRPVHEMRSLIVPMTVEGKPRRCFDASIRYRQVKHEACKYIYRTKQQRRFVGIHRVMPRYDRPVVRLLVDIVDGVLRRAGIPKTLRLRRVLSALRRLAGRIGRTQVPSGGAEDSVGSLFFFHFRALNTGWKHERRVVHPKLQDVVEDTRITAMRDVIVPAPRADEFVAKTHSST